ncbi:MAG TPA: hypothetical protein VMU22_03175 [Rhizomicrobium sp.]|nr:hypothetical protein [Rhizomicrobium sp.]
MNSWAFRNDALAKRALLFVACLGVISVAGCEAVNEGVTDYRKADVIGSATSPLGADPYATNLTRKYDLVKDKEFQINTYDTFYVSLLQAYVGQDARFGGFPHLEDRQEMLIVLRVRDSNSPESPGEFVFYSDDVVRGQFLNFSNMLTLGPTFYQGGVITIDVDEIRIEGTTEHIRKRLQSLADSKMDVVGPDPQKRKNWNAEARDVFDTIDRDAYGTRYTLTLMPSGGVSALPYPRFEAGNYVLMRHDAHAPDIPWGKLELDNNTGRLVNTDPNYEADFAQHSYVTLQINTLRNMPSTVAERRMPQKKDLKPVDAPKYQSLDQARECPLPGDVPVHPGDPMPPDGFPSPSRCHDLGQNRTH